MFWVTVILILQTTISLLLIFLRTHSFRRTLAKPSDGYECILLNWLKDTKTGKSSPFGIRTGAVRSRLISQWGTNLTSYTNVNDVNGFEGFLSDPLEVQNVINNLKQYENNKVLTSQKNDTYTTSNHNEKKTLYGFFHPYCNAFGGGEKVLWKAVETTLNHDLNNVAIIYTGDLNVSSEQILDGVSLKFDYKLDTSRIIFIYLKKRWLVDSKTWPHFTLVGQAFGSIVLTIEAILKCPPDIWCDTMGYPFGYPWVFHFLRIPIITYTHFPVISSDMLDKLQNNMNLKNTFKYLYWKLFMAYYCHMGSYVTVLTTNSTWTNNHINSIWKQTESSIIYPPCSTEKFVNDLNSKSNRIRSNVGVVLAQFRPEKRHDLIIKSYSKYLINRCKHPAYNNNKMKNNLLRLKFIGSTRSQADKDYVFELQKYCKKLNIPEANIEFLIDIPYNEVKRQLFNSTYGINAMWNEHFGIAVVEYLASGLIALVHASAGPYLDIVDDDIGYFFVDPSDPDYTRMKGENFSSLDELFLLTDMLDDKSKILKSRHGEKKAVEKFSDEIFEIQWTNIVLHKLEERDVLKKKIK